MIPLQIQSHILLAPKLYRVLLLKYLSAFPEHVTVRAELG
jgi:hypothetical protein